MKKWLIISLIFAHVLYLQALSFYPYPELFIYPYLVTKGLIPYQHILDQHFPTLLMLPVNLWSLGMHEELQAKLLFFGLIILIHILIYAIAQNIFKKDTFSILPNVFYLALQPLFDGSTLWIDTFITPFALAIVLCIILAVEKEGKLRVKPAMTRFRYWIMTGLLLGAVFTMKQTAAAFVGGVLTFLLLRNKTRIGGILALVASFFFPVCMLVWVQQNNIWSEFQFWTLTFNTNFYSKMAILYPNVGEIVRVVLVWGSAYLFFFLSKKKSREMVLIALSGFLLSFFAFGRFGLSYLQVALPFISLLLASTLIEGSIAIPKNLQKGFKHIPLGFILFPVIIIFTIWHVLYYSRHSQGGSYLNSESTLKIAEEIKTRTDSGDRIFIFGGNPVLYPLTDTIPSGNVYTVLVPWNYAVGQETILKGLKDDPPKLVVVEENAEIDGQKGKYFGKEVMDYIQNNYEKEREIEGHGFYKRKE